MRARARDAATTALFLLLPGLAGAQSGAYNTAVGVSALLNNTIGQANTAIGYQTLFDNTSGSACTAVGVNALFSNAGEGWSTGIGAATLVLSTGAWNTGLGAYALNSNTTAPWNTAIGGSALNANTTGQANTAVGGQALFSNTVGHENAAVGINALGANTVGSWNSALGSNTLRFSTTGALNTAVGQFAMLYGSGSLNTGVGAHALAGAAGNGAGDDNTGVGRDVGGFPLVVGETVGNVGIGVRLGWGRNSGNIVIGSNSWAAGDSNILIGNDRGQAETGTLRLGFDQTRTFIPGIRGTATGVGDAVGVVIDSDGQLGTVSSSGRLKEDIRDMGDISQTIYHLRPVKFRYREAFADGQKPVQAGLIAEEVADVFPDLVVRDRSGQPETVKYDLLVPLMLNELQRQQRRVETDVALTSTNAAELRRHAAHLNDLQQRLVRLEARDRR